MIAIFNFVSMLALLLFLLPYAKVAPTMPMNSVVEVKQVEKPAVKVSEKELRCLAENIYHEARGEGYLGMLAVAKVTLNRVATIGFPGTICGVVHQDSQFSWTASPTAIREREAYNQALAVARTALHIEEDITRGSLFFHTVQIKPPVWTKSLEQSLVLNNHVFYKEK